MTYPYLNCENPVVNEAQLYMDLIVNLQYLSKYEKKRLIKLILIQRGFFPSMWKSSYIIPLFKTGNKFDVSSYHGI